MKNMNWRNIFVQPILVIVKIFEHIYLVINSNNQHRLLRFVFDKYHSLRWHEQLLKHYDKRHLLIVYQKYLMRTNCHL